MEGLPVLQFKDVGKEFNRRVGAPIRALQNINIKVGEQEFVSIIGPSGCGKTTLLKMAAGLERPTEGSVLERGKVVDGCSRERGLVFQNYNLFPWLSVQKNMAFGLRIFNESEQKIEEKITRYLNLTGLQNNAHSYPHELSGGQRQRVALARSWATNPKIFLLDEPFAALDTETRRGMRQLLLDMWMSEPKSALLVTHDIDEALLLSDTIYVLSAGPGTVREKITVGLKRPRLIGVEYSADFLALKKDLQKLLAPAI